MSTLAASEDAQLCKWLVFIPVCLPVPSMLFCITLLVGSTAVPKSTPGAKQRHLCKSMLEKGLKIQVVSRVFHMIRDI